MSDSNTRTRRPNLGLENRDLVGDVLIGKDRYEEKLAKVESLRKQQEAYENCLPKEPSEAFSEIVRTLKGLGGAENGLDALRPALFILNQLAVCGGFDDTQEVQDAVGWLTGQALDGLQKVENATDHACSVAKQYNPLHSYRA